MVRAAQDGMPFSKIWSSKYLSILWFPSLVIGEVEILQFVVADSYSLHQQVVFFSYHLTMNKTKLEY